MTAEPRPAYMDLRTLSWHISTAERIIKREPRRYAFIEEWEPGRRVEVIVVGEIGEEQLEAIDAFVRRQRARIGAALTGGKE